MLDEPNQYFNAAHSASLAGGTSDFLAISQRFSLPSAGDWLPFTHGSMQYLLLLSEAARGSSSEGSRLYQWKGSFVLVQSLTTNSASAADSFTAGSGRTFVAVANAGSNGNRSTDSVIYELVDGQLVQVGRSHIVHVYSTVCTIHSVDVSLSSIHVMYIHRIEHMLLCCLAFLL